MLVSAEDDIKALYDHIVANSRKAKLDYKGALTTEASIKQMVTTVGKTGLRCMGSVSD